MHGDRYEEDSFDYPSTVPLRSPALRRDRHLARRQDLPGDSSDPTSGITYIGAREYDPNSGRFISVDPVLDTSDPQSLNGYTYADNNPVTDSDPTGLWLDDGSGHNEPRSEGPSDPSTPALAYLREKNGPRRLPLHLRPKRNDELRQ
ncbi:RHS repeat-associated core domain-containing protein [Streptomyces mirabilis]|uniref:RHS repeat-associated core domain-containing protein n=1 Tax=Streptomyces mirabilis TaxID=68239 RepID=UPI0033AA6A9A